MKTVLRLPFYVIWALIYAAGFIKLIFVRPHCISEHDRFADRAVYSRRPTIDPLA